MNGFVKIITPTKLSALGLFRQSEHVRKKLEKLVNFHEIIKISQNSAHARSECRNKVHVDDPI